MSEISREEALAHFGVKGMKWGVRREQSSPPGKAKGAFRAVAKSHQDRQIRAHQNALSGKGIVGAAAKLDKYTWGGKGRFEGYHTKKISQLERSKERVDQGELAVRIILFGPQYSKVKS